MLVSANLGMAADTYSKDEIEGVLSSPLRADEHSRQGSVGDSNKAVWYSRALSPYEEQNPNVSTFSYGSLEAYGGDEINQSANIFEELEELRSQNQKLTENNDALHRRLEATEESRTELLSKAEEAKESIGSLLQKQSLFKDQINQLRDEVRLLENNCLSLQTQVARLENEKQSLGKTVRLLETEDGEKLALRKALASLEDEVEKTNMELTSRDIKLKEVMAHRDELIDELLEENKNYLELHKNHKELLTAFQAMKIEKGDLEQSEVKPMRSSVGEELIDKNENLLSELRIMVNEGPGPSPICGLVSYEKTSAEMMESLHTMVESVSTDMERITSQSVNHQDQELLEQNVNELRSQHDSLLCKVKWIMEAKKHSDQRAVSMGNKLKALREENSQLKTQLQTLKEDLSDLKSVVTTDAAADDTDHRLSQALNELELARAEVELMEFTSGRDKQRIVDLESMLTILQKELELKSTELHHHVMNPDDHLTHRAKRQHAKRYMKPLSNDGIGETLAKGGVPESRRTRCSHCKREVVGRNQHTAHDSLSSKPNLGESDVRKLQLQNLSHLDDISSSEEDLPDNESIEPLLESGYRTEASIGRSPIPSKHQLFPPPYAVSPVIDALDLDVFPQSYHPDRSTFLSSTNTLLPHCPRCGYHLTLPQHQVLSSAEVLYPNLFSAFDPISLLRGDATSTTNLSENLEDLFKDEAVKASLQLQDCGTLTEAVEGHWRESPRLDVQEKAICHVCTQTEAEVRICKLVGTQTEEDVGCLLNSSKTTSSKATCTDQGQNTCSRGVSASVVLTEAQAQTDNAERLEEKHNVSHSDNEVDVIRQKISEKENSSSESHPDSHVKSVSVNTTGTQTLPTPNPATSESSFTFDLTIPVPSNDHPPLVKTSSSSSSSVSSIYLAPSSLPAHLISEDWDSDISSDSPLFVSARSSPLIFGKQEGDTSKAVETLSFKPIVSSREKMEQAVPVCLDENSNKDITKHKPSLDRETVLNPEKSTMRQRRTLERERKYTGVIQASNGEMVDLTTADIDVSSISPSDQALNEKLLTESRMITEKFENRRGRRFSPVKKEDHVVSDDSSPESSPEPLKDDLSPRLITEEERVGAEGDSDPEEEKAKSRKDSDDFDIKADIMKAIGPIKTDGSPKSTLSSSQIRQEKKAKRPVFKLPMPELSEETSEDTLSSPHPLPNGTLNTVLESDTDTSKAEAQSECSIKPEGEVKFDGAGGGGEGETKQRKSSILSDTLLKALGLKNGEKRAELTEQEVEEKYNSLTFAFKTDRLTLDQRYKLQEHQRNVIEKNLQDELRDHAGVVQSLERRCADDEIARTDINKLKQHIDVIKYALLKLASKAEGFGAVQQEDRLSRASEIMVTHVENVKRSLEKERSELSEAKRVLHENKILLRGNSISSDDSDSGARLRRASTLTSPAMKHSLHGIVRQKLMRKNPSVSDINDPDESKRRASVAAVLGFGSSPAGGSDGRNRFASLAHTALLDRSSTSPLGGRGVLETCKEGEGEKGDSPRFSEINKKKLSVSISSPPHTGELPPLSPIKPVTPPTPSPTNKSPLLSSTPVVISEDGEAKGNGERTKTEEEIFQQGFEQGVRSQISQELDDLRDQQRALCENLEEIMEAAEEDEDEENEKNSETQPVLKWMQQYSKNIPWSKASRIGRLLLTGTLFILAIISIIGTVLPLERCGGGTTILSAPWEEIVRVLGPYTNIYHPRPPPI